uniref:MHC class I-like antigen recognition-like domain-containing protein n=1 Tax=Peromyscus maniculatus bairdii TaxID=230844 RepID=A0A8C8W7Q3_PERMB
MKTFIPEALLLLLLANLTLTRHPKGSHSLSYLQTLLTSPDFLEPQLIYAVYFNDIHIERFNSREEPPRLMHCAPWVDQQEPEYWDQRTEEVLKLMATYKYILKKMLHIYNLIETGNHTIQILMACDVLPGGNLSHIQYEFVFNGHDYVVLNEDLRTWTAVGKAAEVLRQNWEASGLAKSLKTYLQHKGVKLVLRQLVYGKEILLRTEPPQPSVPIMPIVTGLVLGAVLMGAVVTFLIWKRRTKGKERAGSEFKSPWEYQVQLRVCPVT